MPLYVPDYEGNPGTSDYPPVYCVPVAIMAVTGKPLLQVLTVIRRAMGKPSWYDVRGVPIDATETAMNMLGWTVAEKISPGEWRGYTYLWDWLCSQHAQDPGPYFVFPTHHVIAVADGMACDSFSRVPVPVRHWKREWRPRAEVGMWWRLSKNRRMK